MRFNGLRQLQTQIISLQTVSELGFGVDSNADKIYFRYIAGAYLTHMVSGSQ